MQHPNFKEGEMHDLAKRLHEGDALTPSRPFLVQGLAAHWAELRKEIRRAFETLLQGKPGGAERVAVKAVGAIQEFVRGDYYKRNVPNAESTIRRKSRRRRGRLLISDRPLIDTATMINSLRYVIRKIAGAYFGRSR
jgi:hypothetical protein